MFLIKTTVFLRVSGHNVLSFLLFKQSNKNDVSVISDLNYYYYYYKRAYQNKKRLRCLTT